MRARRYKLVKQVMSEHERIMGDKVDYRATKIHLEQFSDKEIEEELERLKSL